MFNSLNCAFDNEEKSMSSKRESISLVACVEEDRVRLGTFTPCPETNDSSQADAFKRVDVESDFNLRQATWCWHDPSKMELPEQIVVLSHPSLLI